MNRRHPLAVPDLPVKDIAAYFGEVGVEISPTDILRPTPANVQRIYESILVLLEGIQENTQEDETLQTIGLLRRLSRFLGKVCVDDFTIKDFNPDSRRFIRILSGIINFTMFRDNKRHIYERVSSIADENFNARKALEAELREADEEIERVTKEVEIEAGRSSSLEKEVCKLEDEFRELYRHQKDKASEVALLKAEKTEINDKLCSCQLLEHNLQQEIVCLKAQVVSDPGKLVELVKEMRGLIEKERETLRETVKATGERNNQLYKAEVIQNMLSKLMAMKTELDELNQKTEQVLQASLLQESKLKNLESSISAVRIRRGHVERQISHLESKILNLQNKERQYSNEISEKMSKLKLKYDGVSSEREKMLERVRENNKITQELVHQHMTAKSDFDRECSEVIASLVQLNLDINRYFSEIKNCL